MKEVTGRGLEIAREIERDKAAIAAHEQDIIKAKQLAEQRVAAAAAATAAAATAAAAAAAAETAAVSAAAAASAAVDALAEKEDLALKMRAGLSDLEVLLS